MLILVHLIVYMVEKMTNVILSNLVTSVSELKKHPMQIINQAKGEPVAILNRNQPVFYCVTPEIFEFLLEKLENEELTQLVNRRSTEREIQVSIDDL